uniref:Leucine rich repeat containing 25 n=1 Tax=Loxodonta africana TaxID=9785 RepID=G3U9B5_LOXAF
MGGALVWVLLPLVLQDAGTQEYSCPVFSGNVDWTKEFLDTCLNFSNKGLSLPQNQSLWLSRVSVLDLCANTLHKVRIPLDYFAGLGSSAFLIGSGNVLDRVDGTLAARCDLNLKADCGCRLEVWHRSGVTTALNQLPMQCLDVSMGAWRKLSAFLEASCASSLTPTIGGLAAGGCLLLGLAVAGSVLAWRIRRHQMASSRGLRKANAAKDNPRPSLGWQPRYSSQGRNPQPPVVTLSSPHSSDYENMFVGQQDAGPGFQEHHLAEHGEDDFYMNYEGISRNSQPVYCNLASLGR